MIERVLEPEVMDTTDEAMTYDAMDHRTVNGWFVRDALATRPDARTVLDVGCGTGLIPIALVARTQRLTVTAVDLAPTMLARAALNVNRAVLAERIALVCVDAKRLPYAPGDFDLVVSNSLVHHVPDPRAFFAEIARVAGEHGAAFVRDLFRPDSREQLEALVARYTGGETEHARQLFHDSLHAALTVDEVRTLAEEAGLKGVAVSATSDRHWTLVRTGRAR